MSATCAGSSVRTRRTRRRSRRAAASATPIDRDVARRVWRKNGCAARPRCSPPGLRPQSRPYRCGYGRSLRPCLGTSIAPWRRALSRQTLLGVREPATRPPMEHERRGLREQLLRAERLLHVGVRARLERLRRLALLGEGGHDHDRHVLGGLSRAEPPRHLATVEARHHQVEDDEMRHPIERRLECPRSVPRRDDLVAVPLERERDEQEDVRIVVRDQGEWAGAHAATSAVNSLRARTGSRTRTVVPSPSALSIEIEPSCRSTIVFAIVSPSPVPGIACSVAVELRKKRSNSRSCSADGMPTPVSATSTTASPS